MMPGPASPRRDYAVRGRATQRSAAGTVWSVLAGAATAVGLVGAERGYGLLGSVALLAGISLLAVVAVSSVADELHLEPRRSSRIIPLVFGFGSVVTAGWCELAGGYGLVVVALVALGSPWCGDVVRRQLPTITSTMAPVVRASSTARVGVQVDQSAVDRRFRGIVKSIGDEHGDSPARS